jgi:type I restriction enzyme, S subunit
MSESEKKVTEWLTAPLIELADYFNGAAFKPKDWGLDGLPIIRIEQLNNPESETDKYAGRLSPSNYIGTGDLIFSWSATLKVLVWRHGPGALNQHLYKVVPKQIIEKFLLLYLLDFNMEKLASQSQGSTMRHVTRKELSRFQVSFPSPPQTQIKIARILQTVDRAMEKTEALIEKYHQIKAGLMHDLFTRGLWTQEEIDRGDHIGTPVEASVEAGQLRPARHDAPHLYQETVIGWIPKAWEVELLDEIKESLADGPFGSNLKTEHYVTDPGVRVVRLQNVQATEYNDQDRAYVSVNHANRLVRNKVVSNDILIAGLGDDRYPVGRACVYPEDLPAAINKADCFRLRCKGGKANQVYVMYFLNTDRSQKQARRYEQGVTRPRINTGNLKRVQIPLPPLAEQILITKKLSEIQRKVNCEKVCLEKLQKQKSGLMNDLLTGKVPAAPDS